MRFYVGLHQPHVACYFDLSCISVNRLRGRQSTFVVDSWIMDSGAFTEVSTHGGYRAPVKEYAEEARRWIGNGNLEAIVSQDYMCEPWIIKRTGMSVKRHQELTIERYDRLLDCGLSVHILPVLQGFQPEDYVRHLEAYGDRMTAGMWVGVGSVCKRNGKPEDVAAIFTLLHNERPDLRFHGFGLKITALRHPVIRQLLYSADSMAWSFGARKSGRDANNWREAKVFELTIKRMMEI